MKEKKLPAGLKKKTTTLLLEGEHTGHAHRLMPTMPQDVQVYEDDSKTLWVEIFNATKLSHEEHHTQTIEPGIYRLHQVVEYAPFADVIRAVRD